MEKLKKIPTWAWLIIEFLALIIRELYSTIAYAYTAEDAAEFNAIYLDLGFGVNVAPITLTIFDCIIFALLSMLVFEFLASLVYALLLRRGYVNVNREDFKRNLRFYHIIAAVAIGVISMIYFAIPKEYVEYFASPIDYTINSVAYVLCAYFSAKQWFLPTKRAAAYRQAWMLYFIVTGVLYLGSMVGLLALGSQVYEIITEIVLSVNVIIIAPLALIPYFSLKKLDELTIETIRKDNPQYQEKEEIFKDLGL